MTKQEPKSSDACAKIVGDPQRRIWEQQDESLEAFEKRVKAAAEAGDPDTALWPRQVRYAAHSKQGS
jgi:hypothetical protein